jgi:hypothetical protein
MMNERDEMDSVIEAARAEVLPFESWERLAGESSQAFAAFCAFRDLGPERNIRKAAFAAQPEAGRREKKYRMWRLWSARFQWRGRAADYDQYLDRLKLAERRRTIEEREAAYRKVTGKMLSVVERKLAVMEPGELSQSAVVEWTRTAVDTEREIFGLVAGEKEKRAAEPKQLEINFSPEFKGL